MKTEAHTPGPWTWETESGEWPDHTLIGGDGESVVWWDFDLGFCFNSDGDASLIAAAPTMFDYVQLRADAGCPEAIKILEAINARS